MDHYDYTSEQRDMVQQCLAKKDAWFDFFQNGPWEVTNEDKKNGYTIS